MAGEIRDPAAHAPPSARPRRRGRDARLRPRDGGVHLLVPIGDGAISSRRTSRGAPADAMLGPSRAPRCSPASSRSRSSAARMALLFMAPRLYVAMSRDGLFPAALAASRRRAPGPRRARPRSSRRSRARSSLSGSFGQIVAFFLLHDARRSWASPRRRSSSCAAARNRARRFLVPGYPRDARARSCSFSSPSSRCVILARPGRAVLAGFALVLAWPSGLRILAARGALGCRERKAADDLDQDDRSVRGRREAARGAAKRSARSTRRSTRRRPGSPTRPDRSSPPTR